MIVVSKNKWYLRGGSNAHAIPPLERYRKKEKTPHQTRSSWDHITLFHATSIDGEVYREKNGYDIFYVYSVTMEFGLHWIFVYNLLRFAHQK